MKRVMTTLLATVLGLGLLVGQVEAKPLGAGRSSGMKRQTPPPQPAQPVPASPAQTPNKAAATPGAAAPAAPAAAPKRSWMGPLAGLAAGLGIAALMSHFGMGAGLAEGISSILMILLLAGAAFFVVRFLMQRFGRKARSGSNLSFAGAQPASVSQFERLEPSHSTSGSGAGLASAAAQPSAQAMALPTGEEAAALERAAKLIFIRMQAANDAANLDDLRQFSTPEMFANFRLDLQERQGAQQQTDVVNLNARVVELAQENGLQIVSVRFEGLLREERNGPVLPFDEIWHLARPADGSRDWAIAGIAQAS